MLEKSFALTVEAALALVAPEPEEDKRRQLRCPSLRRKRGKEESKGSLEPQCGENPAVQCGASWGWEKSRGRDRYPAGGQRWKPW